MPKINAEVADDLLKKIKEDISIGIYPDISSAVNAALKKAYAKKSRTFLKWLMRKEGITEASLLKEWENIRR
ncbi:MAG: hypothetical protein A2Y62_11800 [Candidatus Fischerbacteria bacterium RBG_13_37_8]|uniref:CopG family transcriptional regulator n=1 Tax=Candidatus Fischerbacteria bacterium RBG_13_37_8 TaxID=1817863 RepID=A0A1F5VUW8_9BACT|nr:MAG: hypothetical protein A2Y62_11800 [Candidatus Fischerbacteria bacterium RBG_13_37_8]